MRSESYRKLIIALGIVAAVIILVILDIWLLGTASAYLLKGFEYIMLQNPGVNETKLATWIGKLAPEWYFKHPFTTAWAWLTKSNAELSAPQVRKVWIFLNCALAVSGIFAYALIRDKKLNPPVDRDRDIRSVKLKEIKFDISKHLYKTPADKFFLGLDDQKWPITLPVNRLTEHIHILGGSGTGKTSFAVMPLCVQAIRKNLPVVVIDFKGDKLAIQVLNREAKKQGKKFYLFSLHPRIKSNTYNPLASGDTLSKVERIMTALNLVYEGPARFYSNNEQHAFLSLLTSFDRLNIKPTLRNISRYLKNSEWMEEYLEEKIDQNHVRGLTVTLLPYETLDVINDPEPDINLAKIMAAGDVVYFDLRSAVAPELSAALGKMIAMDLQSEAVFRTQADKLVLIAIDEFQNMACQAFKNVVSKVRSANYGLVLANQALGDLRSVGEDFLNTVTTNTATKIVFNVEDSRDAEYFARRTGQITTKAKSYSKTDDNPSKSESLHFYDQPLIHQNILLKMPFGKSVIFRRGELAVLANHSHFVTKDEKDRLEQEPYPKPEQVEKTLSWDNENGLLFVDEKPNIGGRNKGSCPGQVQAVTEENANITEEEIIL